MNNNKVLITGGTGMIGKACFNLIPSAIQCSTSNVNLMDDMQTDTFFDDVTPNWIIHLAAKVGGVKANTNKMADFYYQNILINTNVIHSAYINKVKKVVSLLSTCVYPDNATYPLTEDQLHSGFPHSSNFGYAFAKRMLDVQSRAYRKQYGCNFITAIPNNLYGPHDNFDLQDSHVLPAMIRKIYEAKHFGKEVVLWGDGAPLREFTYSMDIARIILFLLKNYNEPTPINIGNTSEHSIKEVAEMIASIFNYSGDIKWDTSQPSGQIRKPSSNQKLLDLGWDVENYTPLRVGLEKTCKWFSKKYPHVRGVYEGDPWLQTK